MKRKIISFTILNNEADIIESFVRYNMTYLDKMIIIDNGCTDNTIAILKNMIAEGIDIEIFDESLASFEQFQIMNKYLRKIESEYTSDIIIPLDSDEFLMCDTDNVRQVLEEISLDKVYKVHWRTFVMDERNDSTDSFVCRAMKYSYLHKDGKVIIPTKEIRNSEIILTAGQHSVEGNTKLQTAELDKLELAHYPNRSMKQFQAKSLCHGVRFINYMNRQTGEGNHRNYFANQCMEHYGEESNEWFHQIIHERMETWSEGIIENHGVNLKLQNIENLELRYEDLANINVFNNVYALAQVMAVKAYNLEIEKKFVKESPTVLVYGTGRKAADLLRGFPEDLINIRAYINTDKNLQYTMFKHRLVISPEMIKFFQFDKIIISSIDYYDEMLETLIGVGVSTEKIEGRKFILELSLSRL